MLSLHGTGGYPEAEWNDWHVAMENEKIAFVSILWRSASTAEYVDDVTLAGLLGEILDTLTANCPLPQARWSLMGFSVGSAMTFPQAYRDVHGKHRFAMFISHSGAAWKPKETGLDLHPTVWQPSVQNDSSAFSGASFFMYCGGKDLDHGWPMCDEMSPAKTFVTSRGAQATLYEDPEGEHGSFSKSPDAIAQLMSFLAQP